jgi:hypothetical protein
MPHHSGTSFAHPAVRPYSGAPRRLTHSVVAGTPIGEEPAMLQTENRALARPQHIFDVPAFTVWGLAGLGTGILKLAHAADDAVRRRRVTPAEQVERPRARLGPGEVTHADLGVIDAWKAR